MLKKSSIEITGARILNSEKQTSKLIWKCKKKKK